VPGISWGDVLNNWLFALIGNFIGAAVFVSGAYWYLYVRDVPAAVAETSSGAVHEMPPGRSQAAA
jgi:glycerol uptake facilitator-like aquaporin